MIFFFDSHLFSCFVPFPLFFWHKTTTARRKRRFSSFVLVFRPDYDCHPALVDLPKIECTLSFKFCFCRLPDPFSFPCRVPRQSQARRLLVYVGLILSRAFGLYMAMNVMQDKILQPQESSMCWYASLRRRGTCSERFDFADHVVLAVCQYLAIQVKRSQRTPDRVIRTDIDFPLPHVSYSGLNFRHVRRDRRASWASFEFFLALDQFCSARVSGD